MKLCCKPFSHNISLILSGYLINCVCRDFPSLGAPSAQQNPQSAQNMWSNPSIRAPSQGNQSSLSRVTASTSSQRQIPDDSSHFGGDNYLLGGSSHQLTGLAPTPTQPQSTSEDFPPLSGLGGDLERRDNLLSAFNSQPSLGLQNSRIPFDQVDIGLRGLGDRNVRF
jgi:hypothetical protein